MLQQPGSVDRITAQTHDLLQDTGSGSAGGKALAGAEGARVGAGGGDNAGARPDRVIPGEHVVVAVSRKCLERDISAHAPHDLIALR